ncbi:MAG: hypothetical protein GX270_08060, partial [Clostridiaceae bacterium]|nr:hypothetical protein [Clostridiaceae bacterium]
IEGTKEAFDLSFDNPDVWLTDQELITNLFKFKEYVRYNNGISYWELAFWQQDLIYEGIRFDRNTTTIDMFFNRLDALRSMNGVPYNPGGTTYIDEGTVQAVIIEELKYQAAETWKKRIPVYLSALKTKILNLNTKYVEFISLTKDERKAIQYALKLYQTGELDHYTSIALDAIHVVNNIPYIEGHTWAITPEMMNVIIDMSNKRAANESINQTLTEISDFAEKYRLGELFYASVVTWAATRMPMGAAYDKAVAEAELQAGPALSYELLGKGDKLIPYASKIKPISGYTDVVVHGSENSFWVLQNGVEVAVDQRALATFLKNNGYSGGPIRLVSCNAGALTDGIAQDLANKLGAEVIAPSQYVYIWNDGSLTLSSSISSQYEFAGNWMKFLPGNQITSIIGGCSEYASNALKTIIDSLKP